MDWILLAELSANGVFVGLMYALVSLGIVLIYKTSGSANLAQGAIAMTGGYVTWALATLVGLPIWVAVPAALVGMFGFGLLMERVALRRMIGQPVIMTIMLTLGVEIMLRIGSAEACGEDWPALIDTTTSQSVGEGTDLVTNHMYMVTISGCGIRATSDTVKVIMRGDYTIR